MSASTLAMTTKSGPSCRPLIAAIRREGQVVLPRGTTPVELGDVLYLLRERDPVR